MIFCTKDPARDFVILNLSDPQLQNEDWQNGKSDVLAETVRVLVESVRPDLITVSGDLAQAGHLDSYAKLADLLASTGVPWAPIFGNHDEMAGEGPVLDAIEVMKKRPGFTFEAGPKELGIGNFIVLIKEGEKPVHAVFLVDTHDMKPWVNEKGQTSKEYSDLSAEQIKWYRDSVDELKREGVPESTLIMHIPAYNYNEAIAAAIKPGVDPYSVDSAEGAQTGCWAEGYEDSFGVMRDISSYPADNGFFDTVLEGGHTKTFIAGHNHASNFSIAYRGVRFVFSLKAGPGWDWDENSNGGTVIKINSDGRATVAHRYVNPDKLNLRRN